MKKATLFFQITGLIILLLLVACRGGQEGSTAPATEPAPPTDLPVTEELEEESEPIQTEEEPTTTPTEAAAPAEEPIYLAIIWHQHQPVYYKNPETGRYIRPWVRVHATKDYVDMVNTVAQYPDVNVTFNLTPSLLRQIDDLANGALDEYAYLAQIPADELTPEQQTFILERFFDTNRNIVARFGRYSRLLEMRDSGQPYTEQDFRDLQVLFNLAWTDPDFLAEEPLAALVEKGRDFSEADKEILFAVHLDLIQQVVPVHRDLQDAGQIEVTMTPFAHPILPLLVDTQAAKIALPEAELPQRFVFGADAQAHVELGVALYEENFGRPPVGMWPAEGSVSQQMISMVAKNGIRWMATDEGVLANSLGFESFTRDGNDLVQETDTLYRPYYVEGTRNGPVAILFRDVVISDKVGFTYSGMDGTLAADDFINRIHEIRDKLIADGEFEANGPHLVSVILDGENAWEFYENDGKAFLNALYQNLSDDPLIETVTPTQFLEIAPEQPQIEELWAGSWINHDFSTWIGEAEENQAWNLLLETREMVRSFENGQNEPPSAEALTAALELMYIAEGSDWFWWYGSDQNSGNDESFDLQFRETQKEIYRTLGLTPPRSLDVPIIPLAAESITRPAVGLIEPEIDGQFGPDEWTAAGLYAADLERSEGDIAGIEVGFDSDNLYFNLSPMERSAGRPLQLFLEVPAGGPGNSFVGETWIGFPANRRLLIDPTAGYIELSAAVGDETWDLLAEAGPDGPQLAVGETIEVALPLALIGNAEVGDRLKMRLFTVDPTTSLPVVSGPLPANGTADLPVPDLGNLNVVLEVIDPENDDHGPGNYTYPGDEVFNSGNFDILNFQVGEDEETVIFKFDIRGPVDNHWDSPNGMSGITLDVYIDTDRDGIGGKALLPGRNLTLAGAAAWDYAVHAEGWTSAIYEPGDGEIVRIAESSQFFVLADAGQRRITIRVPKSIVGNNPADWGYAAVALGQEGFPSGGVLRVRDVSPNGEQWRFGGAPSGTTNHTRVIDLVWPEAGQQENWLSDFAPSTTSQPDLEAETFATIEMLDGN